jgi:ABC-2 type transport system ATP-binding protein
MRAVLRRLARQEGKTIVISSHILPELADLCNKVGIIDKGVMGVNATVDEVMRQVRNRIVLHIQVAGDPDAAAKCLASHGDVESVNVQTLPGQTKPTVVVALKQGVEDYSELPAVLVQAGHKLKLFREEEVNLESAFMALTKGVGAKL